MIDETVVPNPEEDAEQPAEGETDMAETEEPAMSDTELIVRQTKQQFGDTLPKGYLNEEELKLYTRFYGPPLRETRPEDVGMPIERALLTETHKYILVKGQNALLKENEKGELEQIPYHATREAPEDTEEADEAQEADGAQKSSADEELTEAVLPSDAGIDYIKVVAKNQREFNALLMLQRDFEAASLVAADQETAKEYEDLIDQQGQYVEEQEEEEVERDREADAQFYAEHDEREERFHQYTRLGHWRTYPTTLFLPKATFVNPIEKLLIRTDIRHVKEKAQETFGGVRLPNSVATPQQGKGQLPVAMEAGHHRMSEIDADTYIATMLPGMYASVMSILVEVRKRMGPDWLKGLFGRGNGEGPRVLDAGTGGAGLVAWEQVLQAEWDLLHDGQITQSAGPPGKKTVIVGNDNLRSRISRFLQNTSFLPRLPDYLHSGGQTMDSSDQPAARKQYDVIIAGHLLLPLKQGHQRRALLDNLWEMLNPDGGILIVLEKGHPRGFEAVANVRHRLINEFIETPTSDPQPVPKLPETRRAREPGMIIAPCTNHKKCPMYQIPGIAPGRKDFCHFSQRFIRPSFLQRVLGFKHHNHEDIDFSFLAIQRGVTASSPTPVPRPDGGVGLNDAAFRGYEHSSEEINPLGLPRNIMQPLKRRGHVTLDLCTPAGTIERWTVPKSFSLQAYHDARKARWGDLWALGAKTRVDRPVRLGKGGVAPLNKHGKVDGGVRARRAEAAAKVKNSLAAFDVDIGEGGIVSVAEKGKNLLGGRGHAPIERRTKGGKKPLQRKIAIRANEKWVKEIREGDQEDDDDDDDNEGDFDDDDVEDFDFDDKKVMRNSMR